MEPAVIEFDPGNGGGAGLKLAKQADGATGLQRNYRSTMIRLSLISSASLHCPEGHGGKTMKKLAFLSAAMCLAAFSTQAQSSRGFSYGTGSNSNSNYVAPHSNSNGSHTDGYYRTNPDSNRSNNYGSYGNYNSYNNGVGNGYGGSVPRY
ncbi:hypothetical protein [Bosea sp. 685]|uniref:hypothetical protein n=1 Tax=Bosea sp. 685 TaxID=3080057 RepID=UPI0028931579|nr:hypothetical protein [Bosea sp. 685]WNJ88477.1 hypothetical protein RMR04_18910 [Bosea sp. 685]